MNKKVVAIVGSYRKGHVTDTAVSAVLKGAQEDGAETQKMYLLDKHVEFCANCRACTQQQAQTGRAKCVHDDDMEEILNEIDTADGLVLASPINFSTVTAIMKRFIERLLVFTYWPWGSNIPRFRMKKPNKTAVIITSSGCPAWLGRILMPNALSVLKAGAKCMGAKVIKKLYFGLVASEEDHKLNEKALKKAHRAGKKLIS
jgi:NAD(P)H-dependent FMN reductase